MKLTSMTDFVLYRNEVATKNKNLLHTDWAKEFEIQYRKILNYAKFLKQPLTLGMFVPCDEEGNVLEEPLFSTGHSDNCYCESCVEEGFRYENYLIDLEQAKERVLFKGFELNGRFLKNKDNGYSVYLSGKEICNNDTGREIDTIEGVIEFLDIELTESALKQIGL